MSQTLFQAAEHFRRDALLRTEDARRTELTEKGIFNVTKARNAAGERCIGRNDLVHARKFRRRGRHDFVLFIEKLPSQRRSDAGSGIVRRASTQPDHEILRAARDGINHQLTRAKCGSPPRIAFCIGNPPKSRCGAHIDHRDFAAGNPCVGSRDRASECVMCRDLHSLPAKRLAEDLSRSLSAVSHRHDIEPRVGKNRKEAVANRRSDLNGGEGTLELVRGDQNPHQLK